MSDDRECVREWAHRRPSPMDRYGVGWAGGLRVFRRYFGRVEHARGWGPRVEHYSVLPDGAKLFWPERAVDFDEGQAWTARPR